MEDVRAELAEAYICSIPCLALLVTVEGSTVSAHQQAAH